MSIWIVIFVLVVGAAVLVSRRVSGGTPGGGCHGGAHGWPPDDITSAGKRH